MKDFCQPGVISLFNFKTQEIYYIDGFFNIIESLGYLFNCLEGKKCPNPKLQQIYNLNREEFSWCVLAFCSKDDLDNQIRIHIQNLKPSCNKIKEKYCPICGNLIIKKQKFCSQRCYREYREGHSIQSSKPIYEKLEKNKDQIFEWYQKMTASEISYKLFHSHLYVNQVIYFLKKYNQRKVLDLK